MDLPELIAMLQMNQDKNFVQRLLMPDISPILYFGEPGQWGTHLMSGTTLENGDTIVYPRIIQPNNGNLKLLDNNEAIKYALQNNEYIKVKNAEEANYFGKNYKKIWGWQ